MSRANLSRPSTAELARVVVNRQESLFQPDVDASAAVVSEQVAGRPILVVGGAGSIGAATVRELLSFAPSSVCVVDVNENGLTELLRDLRAQDAVATTTELHAVPLDMGSPTMRRVLATYGPFDAVLNFAAVKHVRSERDTASLLHMLDVNVVKARRLLAMVAEQSPGASYFAVSTDKAANPVNLMGCSKRVMELVMFAQVTRASRVTSARFANVAFSDGSLLDGWLRRLDKGQPWAVPGATRRFFVTPQESGQLCLLGAVVAPDRHVVYPSLDPETALQDLEAVALRVMDRLGLTPLVVSTEAEARAAMGGVARGGPYPLLVTALDTMGEKEFEEFVAEGDVDADLGLAAVRALRPPEADTAALSDFTAWLDRVVDDADLPVDKDDILARLAVVVPELEHRGSTLSLDERM